MMKRKSDSAVGNRRSRRRLMPSLVAGVTAGLIAVAMGGVAVAQSGGPHGAESPAPQESIAEAVSVGVAEAVVFDAEQEQAWADFDQCIIDAGVNLPAEDEDTSVQVFEIDEDILTAAFDSCENVLGELGDMTFGVAEAMVLDAEEERAWADFDQCLIDAGVNLPAEDEDASVQVFEIDEDTLTAAFDSCENVLGDLADVTFGVIDGTGEFNDQDIWLDVEECMIDAGVEPLPLGAGVEVAEIAPGEFHQDGAALVQVFEVDADEFDGLFGSCEVVLDDTSHEEDGKG